MLVRLLFVSPCACFLEYFTPWQTERMVDSMRYLLVMGFALTAFLPGVRAMAGLTPVMVSHDRENEISTLYEGAIGYSNGPTIMSRLYGTGNYVRVQDTGSNTDQVWGSAGSGLKGGISAQVRYASDTTVFGVFKNPESNANMTDLATISGSGFDAEFSRVNLSYASNIKENSFELSGFDSDPFGVSLPFALAFRNKPKGNSYSSVQDLNTDLAGQLDHIVTFLITGGRAKGSYVVAFEDRSAHQGGVYDYNDAVVQLNGLVPMPEPTSFAIAGLGAFGFGFHIWRQRRPKA